MLELNEEQGMVVETAREFNEKVAPKFIETMDRENTLPRELISQLAQSGLLAMKVPEQFGGGGMDELSAVLAIEELARVSPAIADILCSVNASTGAVIAFGTDDLKEHYLPPAADGTKIPAYALTEPDAGSDLAAIRTTARRDGDRFLVNGSKTYITLGAVADYGVVLVITNPEADKKHHGMSLLVVEGFDHGKEEDLLGLRGLGVGEMSFADTEVPIGNVLGEVDRGFQQIMQSLDGGRIEIA